MKKNKTVTITLIIAVIIVWGLVIYNIAGSISPGNKTIHTSAQSNKPSITANPERYNLSTYERDPFLSIISDTSTTFDSVIPPATPPVYTKPILRKMPVYCGIIKNNKTTMAVIKINSIYYNVSESYRDDSIRIIKITDTTVTLSYQDEKLTLHME